jgi:hypothetical protein
VYIFGLWCYLSISLFVSVPESTKISLRCLLEKQKVNVGGTDDGLSNENSVDSEEGESGDDEVCISDES